MSSVHIRLLICLGFRHISLLDHADQALTEGFLMILFILTLTACANDLIRIKGKRGALAYYKKVWERRRNSFLQGMAFYDCYPAFKNLPSGFHVIRRKQQKSGISYGISRKVTKMRLKCIWSHRKQQGRTREYTGISQTAPCTASEKIHTRE